MNENKVLATSPSMPYTFWIPGTRNIETANGDIPYYNKPLGVVHFTGKPTVNVDCLDQEWESSFHDGDIDRPIVQGQTIYTFPQNVNYSNYLIINPEVRNIANITIEKQDLIVVVDALGYTTPKDRISNTYVNPRSVISGGDPYWGPNGMIPVEYGVRFAIRVTPKDGSPSSLILKTLKLEPKVTYRYEFIY